jgi:nucleoside-diphosphate-sugar epimerase
LRILITGASGFLGRHLVEAAKDHVVIRATRGRLSSGPGELALGEDFWDRGVFRRALAEAEPDVVFHCAGVTQSVDARQCFLVNSALAAELLHAIGAQKTPARVIMIGSAAEYGNVPAEAVPVVETRPCEPRTLYGVAKHAQTLLGLAAAASGLPVLVARLFNPVGVGMPAHLALSSFAAQIASAKPDGAIRVGDLSAERDFLDVEEASRILLGLAERAHWPWPLLNLCSGRAYRIGDLLTDMFTFASKPLLIEYDLKRMRPDDMKTFFGSAARLSSIGLTPQAPDFGSLLPKLLSHASQK